MTKPRRWRLRIVSDGRLCAWEYEDRLGGTPVREDCITSADVVALGKKLREHYELEHDGVGIPDSDFEKEARSLLSTIFKDGET